MSKLWKPDDAGKVVPVVSVVRVRPLLPPPPQAGVRLQPQHLHWQVGRYKEDLSFGPGGRGRRKRWVVDMEAEQHNIVLNNAYELMAVHGITLLTRYAVVGTGSTPPDPSQLALANEVARTIRNDTGSTSGTFSYTRVANGVYEQTVVREFLETEVGNRNLTEWGFSPVGTAGGNLMSRELFRDGNGNPIVISLASDQRLRLIYKTRITLSPVVPVPVSINISGIGIRSGLAVLTLSAGGGWAPFPDLVTVEVAMTGQVVNSMGDPSWDKKVYLLSVTMETAYASTTTSSPLANKWPGVKEYTPNSRRRQTNPVTFFSNEGNGTIRTIGLGPAWGGGFRFVLNSGQEITKTNLYKLTIGEFTITWGP
ncbi:hypothetical protein [Thermus hydrothermalis]|uniref:hypothetical protein n=1 Tax=Thermus hydrothermalis TaxID=2908148 RepID=UPI001FA9CE7E|nr:hypothetical protein [Thermus hydrothermalis]